MDQWEHAHRASWGSRGVVHSSLSHDQVPPAHVALLKSYCLPFMSYAVEAVSLSPVNIRTLENCINRAMYWIFGACDKRSLEYIKSCVSLDNMKYMIERSRKRYIFIDRLIDDARFSNLLLVNVWNWFDTLLLHLYYNSVFYFYFLLLLFYCISLSVSVYVCVFYCCQLGEIKIYIEPV